MRKIVYFGLSLSCLAYFAYVYAAKIDYSPQANDAGALRRGTISNDLVDTSSVTKQGNTFNGASQLLLLNSNVDISIPGNLTSSGTVILGNAAADLATVVGSLSIAGRLNSSGTVVLGDGVSDLITVDGELTISGRLVSSGTSVLGDGAGDLTQVTGDLSSSGIFTSSGTTRLGDASGDLITVNAASMTFINGSTISFNISGSRINYYEANACSQIFLDSSTLAADGLHVTLFSSSPATADANQYATVDNGFLNTLAPKAVNIRAWCQHTQDGVSGNANTTLYFRKTGSGIGIVGPATACLADARAASESTSDYNDVWLPLDSNYDFDFACIAGTAIDAQSLCEGYMVGVCR